VRAYRKAVACKIPLRRKTGSSMIANLIELETSTSGTTPVI
jgi:hypothetical protein